jgi:hypothetical protein
MMQPNHRLERTAQGGSVCMFTDSSTFPSLRTGASRRGRSAVGR